LDLLLRRYRFRTWAGGFGADVDYRRALGCHFQALPDSRFRVEKLSTIAE